MKLHDENYQQLECLMKEEGDSSINIICSGGGGRGDDHIFHSVKSLSEG